MKIKDWFNKIAKQGKINNEDFTKFIEALKDTDEIPDVFTNLFDENFLTFDRAVADGKVYDKIRGEVLDGVKLNIKEILPMLSPEDQEAISKEPRGFSQVKMLKPALEKTLQALKEAKPASDDEKVKELKNQVAEFSKKLTEQKNEYENKFKETQTKFESEKKGLLLDFSLNNKLSEFTFADEYKEVRPTLTKSILEKIKTENVLVLDENTGQIAVHEKTATEGVTKPRYNGNDLVTLDKLLEEPLKPFLKKNTGAAGAGAQPGAGQTGSQGRTTPTPGAKTRDQMTLRELNLAGMS